MYATRRLFIPNLCNLNAKIWALQTNLLFIKNPLYEAYNNNRHAAIRRNAVRPMKAILFHPGWFIATISEQLWLHSRGVLIGTELRTQRKRLSLYTRMFNLLTYEHPKFDALPKIVKMRLSASISHFCKSKFLSRKKRVGSRWECKDRCRSNRRRSLFVFSEWERESDWGSGY